MAGGCSSRDVQGGSPRNLFTDEQRGNLTGRDPRFALIYPSSGTRDGDFWRYAPPTASVYMVRIPTSGRTVSLQDGLPDESELLDLLRDASLMAVDVEPTAVSWADTSGSFMFGPEGDLRQIAVMSEVTGVYANTTSTAIVDACHALEIDEIDVASPYPNEYHDLFREFLAARGIRVGNIAALELRDSYAIAAVSQRTQADLVRAAAASAPAIVIPCTDFFSVSLVEPLEAELGRIVIAANVATMWHLVTGTGGYPAGSTGSFGRLFREAQRSRLGLPRSSRGRVANSGSATVDPRGAGPDL